MGVYGCVMVVFLLAALCFVVFLYRRDKKRLAKVQSHQQTTRRVQRHSDTQKNITNRMYNALSTVSRENLNQVVVSKTTLKDGSIAILVRLKQPSVGKDLPSCFLVQVMSRGSDEIHAFNPQKRNWYWSTDEDSILRAICFLSDMTKNLGVDGNLLHHISTG